MRSRFDIGLGLSANIQLYELAFLCISLSDGASGGTCPGVQALGAHQHAFCSNLKTRFIKQKFRPNYA